MFFCQEILFSCTDQLFSHGNVLYAFVEEISDITPVSSNEFRHIQITTECRFTLKRVWYMKRIQSQMHNTYNCSQYSSIIWLGCLNG